MTPIVEFRNITKKFVGTVALDNVSFGIEKGEVHVLVGENGAGKSTLLKILSGLYQSDGGEILYKGNKLQVNHPTQALNVGIAMVYQELTVLPNMTVLDNVYLTDQVGKLSRIVNRKKQEENFQKLQEKYGIYVEPYEMTGNLSIAEQQKVEILKMLSRDPDVIVLDEPTAVLPKDDVDVLFKIVRNLVKHEKTVVFISHRMEEIFEIGNRATILKDGKWVATLDLKETNVDEIIRYMVGRELKDVYPPKGIVDTQDVIYEVENINCGTVVRDVSFQVRRGEILGVAGLQGHGQTELLRILSGNLKADSGTVKLKNKVMTLKNSEKAISEGVGYVPESRKEQSLFPELSVRINMTMSSIGRHMKRGMIDLKSEKNFVNEEINKFSVKLSGMEQHIVRLSGGNQQKVILAKVLATEPEVLIFNEPTRGIDVQTKYEIYKLMRQLSQAGIAVIVNSSDMMEVIGISDSVIVMYEGRITEHLYGEDITEDRIMASAVGVNKGGTV